MDTYEPERPTVIRLTKRQRVNLHMQQAFENRSMNRIIQSAIDEYLENHKGKWDEFRGDFESKLPPV